MNNIPPPISRKPEPGVDGELKKDESVMKKVKPPLPAKPGPSKTSKAPPVKRKPLTKSQSVDNCTLNKHSEHDLTQIGGSEWRDFVSKRQEKEEDDQELLTPTIHSLNIHRQSLTGAEQTIVEGQVLKPIPLDQGEDIKVLDMPAPVDVDWKKTETLADDVFAKEPDAKVSDIKHNGSDILYGECKNVAVSNGINGGEDATHKEPYTENTAENTPPVTITLPKPRQIVSEIKRKSFAKTRSMSLPATHLGPQIKRSSDILKEASAQTPYFCRLSRGSVDLLDGSSLAGLRLKEVSETENTGKPET